MKKAVFNMEPFSCPSCIKKIESTLLKVDGVREAKVLFHSGHVRVEFEQANWIAQSGQRKIDILDLDALLLL